jgi:hypothetical protein
VAVATPTAEIDGATATTASPTISAAGAVTVGATSANQATISESLISLGIISGGIAVADATITGGTGSTFTGSITKSASVSVTSGSGNNAKATTTVVSGSLAAVAYSGTNATVGSGAYTSTLVGGGTIDSTGSVTITSGSDNIATVTTDTVGAGGLAVAVATPTAEIDGATTTTAAPSISTSGAVTVRASSSNQATIGESLVAAGIISGGIAVADATITGGTSSTFDGSVTQSTFISVASQSGNNANATTTVVSGSLAAVAYSGTNATVGAGADTSTAVGGGILDSTGLVSISSGSANIATVITDTVGAGVIGVAVSMPTAEIDGATTTTAAPTITTSGIVLVGAASANQATITESLVAAGIIAAGAAVADATITGATSSTMDGSVLGSSEVTVGSDSNNDAAATTTVVTGSLVSVSYSGTNATIGSGADTATSVGSGTIDSSGAVVITSESGNIATVTTDTVGAGVIGVAVSMPTAEIDAATTTTASPNITTTGAVTVEATSGNEATISESLVAAGIIAAGAAVADATITGATSSTFNGSVPGSGSVAVTSQSNNTAGATTTVISGSLVSVSYSGTNATIGSGADTATSVGSGTIDSSGAVTITSDSDNQATVTTDTVGAGVIGIAVSMPTAEVDGATTTTASPSITTTGAVTVGATSDNTANIGMSLVAAGIIAAGAAVADATITGATSSTFDGSVPGSGSVSVTSQSTNTAGATTTVISGSLVSVSYSGTNATVTGGATTSGANTTTSVGGGTIDSSGAVTIRSNSVNEATVNTDTVGAGVIGISISLPTVEVDGATTTTSDAIIKATGAVMVGATSSNDGGITESLIAAGLIAAGAAFAKAIITGPTTTTMNGSISGLSSITVSAHSSNDATATMTSVVGGAVGVDVEGVDAEVTSGASTSASAGNGTTLSSGVLSGSMGVSGPTATPPTLTVEALSANNASVSTNATTGALIGVSVAGVTNADVNAATTALFDGDLLCNSSCPSQLSVEATSANAADATGDIRTYGLVAVSTQTSSPTAAIGTSDPTTNEALTTAVVGPDADLEAPTSSVSVSAVADNDAGSNLGQSTGGGISIGYGSPAANDYGVTEAQFLGDAEVGSASSPGALSLAVTTNATDDTDASYFADNHGAITVQNGEPDATTGSMSSVELGCSSTAGLPSSCTSGTSVISVVNGITETASDDSDSVSQNDSNTGGAINVNNDTAEVNNNPTVDADVSSSTVIAAGGDVTVSALQNTTQPGASNGTFDAATDVNSQTQTITFSGFDGLVTGDSVTYQSNGSQAVGNLTSGDSYDVIVVPGSSDAIQLGATFEGVAVTSSGACPTGYTSCVDTADSEIVFSEPGDGGLNQGDEVIYEDPNGTPIAGLTPGTIYMVQIVDATHIRLIVPTTHISIGFNGTNLSGNNIEGNPGFSPNQAVTYTAPTTGLSFSSGQIGIETSGGVAVFNSMNQVQYSGGNNIYLPNYGYSTGEEVTFESTGNVTGLSSGTDYYVIDIDANDFELAANYCDTGIEVAACAEFNGPHGAFSGYHSVDPVGLSPNYSQSAEQVVNTFYVTGEAPIAGLTNGGVYYVVGLTGTSFEVALAPNGSPIGLNGSNSENAQSLFQAYYAGLYSVGSGTGELVEDISASSGTQSFTGVPGIPVAGVSTGDGVSTATASGSGGGFVNVGTSDTTADDTTTIGIDVGNGASITAGGDVSIITDSIASVYANAGNSGDGFVAVNGATANASATGNTSVTLEANSQITAAGNVNVTPSNTVNANTNASSSGGGLGAGANTTTTTTANFKTQVFIYGEITATGNVTVDPQTTVNGDAQSASGGEGFGASVSASSTVNIGQTESLTTVELESGSRLTGQNVTVEALVDAINAYNSSYSSASAFGASSDSSSPITVDSNPQVTMDENSKIVAYDTTTIEADGNGLNLNSQSDSNCGCAFGSTSPNSGLAYTSDADVTTLPTATIRTGNLIVETNQNVNNWTQAANQGGGFIVFGGGGTNTTYLPSRNVNWSATVILHAPDPILIVSASGQITTLEGVTVTDGGVTYTLGQFLPANTTIDVLVTDNGGGTALFSGGGNMPSSESGHNAPQSKITDYSSAGIFEFQPTFDSVTILNYSPLPMVIEGVTVANLTGSPATITIDYQVSTTITFSLNTNASLFAPTYVDIENVATGTVADSELTIAGVIDNPIGTTLIDNQRGDILATSGALVESNILDLYADAGSIGVLGSSTVTRAPLPVEMVQSNYDIAPNEDPTRLVQLVGEALGNIVLDLTTTIRGTPTGTFTPSVGPFHAGGSIDIELEDSEEGTDLATFSAYAVSVVNPNNHDAGGETGTYYTFYWPDGSTPPSFSDIILQAFGTDLTPINSNYLFPDVSAGTNIDIHLAPTATQTLTLTVDSNVDATLNSSLCPLYNPTNPKSFLPCGPFNTPVPLSQSDGIGEIDLYTNGFIIDTEGSNSPNLRVGTIESTESDVTLLASATNGSIFGVPPITGTAPTTGVARVIGNNITLTTTANGGIGSLNNFLDINSQFSGPGVVTADAQLGIYLLETAGDMVLNNVESTTGDVYLIALTGSIYGETPIDVLRVFGNNITLTASEGGIGFLTNFLYINSQYSGPGVVTANALNGIYLVETAGAMDLNVVDSTTGDVYLVALTGSIYGEAPTNGVPTITGNNITLTASEGGIGYLTPIVNYLEINSQNFAPGGVTANALNGIYLVETAGRVGDMDVNVVDSVTGDVALITLAGSILDADTGTTTNVTANNLDLIAHGGGIGSYSANGSSDLIIDANYYAGDRVYFLADCAPSSTGPCNTNDGIYITQTLGGMNIIRAESVYGSIRLTFDNSSLGPANLNLLAGGSTLDGATTLTEGRIVALGDVLLLVGNNVNTPTASLIQGATVEIYGDYGPLNDVVGDPGSVQYYRGTVTGHATNIYGGDQGTNSFNFINTYLGGQTNVFGTGLSTPTLAQPGNTFFVYELQTMTGLHTDTSGDALTGTQIRDNLTLDGQQGNNTYLIDTWGSESAIFHDYIINVLDSGPLGGIDTLTINGGVGPDVYLMRGTSFVPGEPQAQTPSFVAVLHGTYAQVLDETFPQVEMINYDDHENLLTVNGTGQNDTFAVDNNSSNTVINGGTGNDTFFVGQTYYSPRITPDVAINNEFATVDTNRGWISPGNTFPLTIYGDTGNDDFFIYSDQAPLRLEAGSGNDTFAFETSVLVNPTTGAYLYDSYASALPPGTQVPMYLLDDPVTVDGGSGTSSLYVLETTIADAFNLSIPGSVFGAGVSVTFTNLANGPFIVAPTPTQQSLVNVNGNPVVARSLLGTSALLAAELFGTNQVPVNQNPYLLSDPITGALGYYVASAQTGQIIITQPGGSTTVSAPGSGLPGSSTATYTIQLASAPTSDVWVILSVGSASSPIVLISVNGGVSFGSEEVVEFTPADWNVPITVTVEAITTTAALYGRFFATIMTSSESADPNYNHVDTEDVIVNVQAAGQAGVDVSQPYGGPTVLTGTPPYGIDSSYSLWLANAPAPGTTVTVTLGFNGSALVLSSTDPRYNPTTHTVTFNSTNWNVPVTIIIAAYVTNYGLSGPATITETVTSTDPGYTAWFGTHAAPTITVNVDTYNGTSVLLTPVNPPLVVSSTVSAYFTVRLAEAIVGDENTKYVFFYTNGNIVVTSPTPNPNFVPATATTPAYLMFTSTNWWIPVTLEFTATGTPTPTDPNQPLMYFPPRYDQPPITEPGNPLPSIVIDENFCLNTEGLKTGPPTITGVNCNGILIPLRQPVILPTESGAGVPPQFTEPNIVVPGTGPTGATVTYTTPTFTDNYPPVTFTYSVPSGSLFGYGTTTVTVKAKDQAGNYIVKTFTVSVLPSFTMAPVNATNAGAVTLSIFGPANGVATYIVTDAANKKVTGTVNLSAAGTATVVLNLSSLTNGTLVVTGTVTVGATVYTDIPLSVAKNSLSVPAPTVTLVAADDTGQSSTDYITNDNTPQFTVTGQTGATFLVYVNGVLYTGQHLADGTYTVTATATNSVGTVSPLGTATKKLVIDTAPPTGSFTITGTVINGQLATAKAALALQLTFSDPDGLWEMAFSINGGAFSAATAYATTASLTLPAGNGIDTVTVRITDVAGNTYTVSETIRLDTTGPVITDSITAPTNAGSYDTGTPITLTAGATDVDNVTTLKAVIDGTITVPIGTAFTIDGLGLAPGSHTLVITAIDALGNVSTARYTFKVHATVVGLENALTDGVTRGQITTSAAATALNTLLTTVATDVAANQNAAAKTEIQSFITAVAADSGTTISAAYATLLEDWAADLKPSL